MRLFYSGTNTDQPASFGTTFAVTEVSPDEWTAVRKKDGRVEIKVSVRRAPCWRLKLVVG